MYSAKRAKRDTAENLYKTCRMGGDCLPDVVNKLENKTWADTLLQVFSSILFLGNLGIGTGKGTGGVVTARPSIPETIAPVRPSQPTVARPGVSRPVRPFSVPIDTIGIGARPVDPTGIRPVDVVDPSSPAIVTLNETSPDTVITLGEPGVGTGDIANIPDLTITTDTTSIQSHPTIHQTTEGTAIINVTPADPPPTRVIFSTSTTLNPVFSIETVTGHIDPDLNVFVDPLRTGDNISFGEEIPLEPINPIQEFELEDIPKTSTPSERLYKAVDQTKQFYRKYIQQTQTRNVNLFGDVSRAIQFGFENPAFDPEVSLEFEQDVNQIAAAPDEDFIGVKSISRPYYSLTGKGNVRVSRLGTKAGVTTRSGVILGQPVHYYYDFSTIEEIELPTLTQSTSTGLIEMNTESTFIDASGLEYPELLDTYNENFDDAHLLLDVTEEQGERNTVPVTTTVALKPFVTDIAAGVFVTSNNATNTLETLIPAVPIAPTTPADIIVYDSADFYLHPSFYRRRKRKRSELF